MRKRAKSDGNQTDLVRVLRQLGFDVDHTHQIGGGFPDLVLAKFGRTVLAEIKNASLPPSKRRLTKAEEDFHQGYRGHVVVLETTADCITLEQELSRDRR